MEMVGSVVDWFTLLVVQQAADSLDTVALLITKGSKLKKCPTEHLQIATLVSQF